MIQGNVEIKWIDEDTIKILGVKYYTAAYLNEMMRREYLRGLHKGETIHRLEVDERAS